VVVAPPVGWLSPASVLTEESKEKAKVGDD